MWLAKVGESFVKTFPLPCCDREGNSYQTNVIRGAWSGESWRYKNKKEARDGHNTVKEMLRAMSKETVWTCDWCNNASNKGESWQERKGKIPHLHRDLKANEKYFIVVEKTLHFCTNPCNQAHKDAAAAAETQARAAWLGEYNKHHA